MQQSADWGLQPCAACVSAFGALQALQHMYAPALLALQHMWGAPLCCDFRLLHSQLLVRLVHCPTLAGFKLTGSLHLLSAILVTVFVSVFMCL